MPDPIQSVGLALQAQCPRDTVKSLLYAELDDGVISSSVFFLSPQGEVHFRYASDELEELVYQLWERGFEKVAPKSWAAVEYSLAGQKLALDFTFPEHMNSDEGQRERRPRAVTRHFGNCKVNYLHPNG